MHQISTETSETDVANPWVWQNPCWEPLLWIFASTSATITQ